MKRILASVLALAMTLGIVSTGYAEENNKEERSANVTKIVFDKDGCTKTDNVTRVGYTGKAEIIGGEYALKRDHNTEEGRHIQIVTDNEWLYAPEGTPVEIEIEYFDN